MAKMLKVNDLYFNGSTPTSNYIEEILTDSTNTAREGESPVHLFSTIMMPIREYDSTTNKLSDTYTYHNVGMTTTELADLYWTEYGGEYLIGAGRGRTISDDVQILKKRCKAIFNKNYGKYLKMIEMTGLIWNPLWNVDGTELRQIIENDAAEIIKDQGSVSSAERSNQKTDHNTSSYDGELKAEWSETVDGVTGSFTPSATTTIGEETATSTGTSVTNPTVSGGSVNSNIRSIEHGELSYSVDAADTAFGTALAGGDRLHTEKYVRQGNIGVTETTQLLEHARNYLRFSIIEEFFKDINKVILIGIYDQ